MEHVELHIYHSEYHMLLHFIHDRPTCNKRPLKEIHPVYNHLHLFTTGNMPVLGVISVLPVIGM